VTPRPLSDVTSDGTVFEVSICIYLTILLLSSIVTNPAQSEIRTLTSGGNFSFSSVVPSLVATACWSSAVLRGRFACGIRARTFFFLRVLEGLPFAC
jgi:hypothetical protein